MQTKLRIHSITAKCALKYMFELAAEMKRNVSSKEDLDTLHQQTINKLEQQMKDAAHAHHQEIVRIEREHQEKVFVLLKQLQGYEVHAVGDSVLVERLQIQNQELDKMEALRKELEEKSHEIDNLKSRLHTPKKQHKRKSSRSESSVLAPDVTFDISLSDVEEDDVITDPDWKNTPIFKRLQKMKNEKIPLYQPEQQRASVKRNSDGQVKCTCKSAACKTKICGCRKVGSCCAKDCKCDPSACQNRNASKTLFGDSGSESSIEENKDPEGQFKKPRAMTDPDENTIKKNGKYFKI